MYLDTCTSVPYHGTCTVHSSQYEYTVLDYLVVYPSYMVYMVHTVSGREDGRARSDARRPRHSGQNLPTV